MDEISFKRLQDLQRKNVTSQQNLDEAKAKLDAARAQQSLDQVRLDKTVIRAPFAGTVGLRLVSPGAYVKPGRRHRQSGKPRLDETGFPGAGDLPGAAGGWARP
ncbi:MAG: hypothetical protein MZV65_13775 [Chromatiales bacterium]|nr:hypothetical protein [Chromatiales bacterium]